MITVRSKLEDKDIDVDSIAWGLEDTFVKAVGSIAKSAQDEWIRLAQNRLQTSRHIYIGGLQQAQSFTTRVIGGATIFEITLVGRMPNNFEFGMDPFDMKAVRPGWLGGKKAKTAKDGSKYIIIPFRHSLSSDATLGYTGKAKRADLKAELKRTVREYGLDKMVRMATGNVAPGPVKRVPVKPNVHPYLHGLTKVQTPTVGRTPTGLQMGSSQLFTWRVMSEKSDPGSWQHPGLTAQNILEEVSTWLDGELDRVTDIMFGSL